MTMTKAEILGVWKEFVKHMSDQGAVVPFAHEIARRACNELLDRLEAAEKENDTLSTRIDRMRSWIHNEGARNNVCTYSILGEVCRYCECERKESDDGATD